MVAKWILLEPGVDTIQAGDERWRSHSDEWVEWPSYCFGEVLKVGTPCRRRVVDPVCTREAYGSGGAPSPRECGICGVGPCSKADTVSSIAESPDDWVIQDRVPARPGIDQAWWCYDRYPKDQPASWWKVSKDSFTRVRCHGDRMLGDDATLHLRCRRKDLPPMPAKTRTVTLREWVCWDDCAPGVYTIDWCSVDPSTEHGKFTEFDHVHATGNTREIEVPCE